MRQVRQHINTFLKSFGIRIDAITLERKQNREQSYLFKPKLIDSDFS